MNKACLLSVLVICTTWVGFSQQLEKIGQLSETSPDFVVTHWGMSDGMPSDRVRDVLQTRDGYIWIATFNGLARFDGVHFRVFNDANTPELKNRLINRLDEDSQGRLWIGSDTGEIVWHDDKGFHVVPTPNSWKISPILRMVNTPSGSLLVINRDGQLLEVKNKIAGQPIGGTPSEHYFDAVVDSKNRIWVLYFNGQMRRFENGADVPDSNGPAPAAGDRNVAPAREGGFWVRDGFRLRRWNNGRWVEDRGSHNWGPGRLIVIHESSSGDVLVGTANHGLFIIGQGGKEIHLTRSSGLTHNWVTSICEDREKDIWIGSNGGGLQLLRKRVVTMLTPKDHWKYQPVQSVTPAKAGGVWIGTLGAGVYRYDGKQLYQLEHSTGEHSAYVRTLLEDGTGRLWVGTEGRGLYWWRDGKFGAPRTSSPLPGVIFGLSESSDSAIWICFPNGVYRRTDAGYQLLATNLIQPDVRCAVQAPDGAMWIGMRGGGVARWKDGEFKQFLQTNGLPYPYVWSMFADKDGSVWIGTAGGGLARYRNGRFVNFTKQQGLPSDFICDIQADDSGNLWVASYGGIFRVNKHDLDRCARGEISKVNCLVLDASDGITSLEMSGGNQPAGCRTPDGRFWFASSGGLAVVDPKKIRIEHVPPPVVIEDVLVDGTSAKIMAVTGQGVQKTVPTVIVPPGGKEIQCDYAALSYDDPHRVRFKYRMDGLEQIWVDAGNRHSAFYTHLPPGKYSFQVIACNRFGFWNKDGATVRITVMPYLWQTWWFVPLCWILGATLAGVFLVSILRRRHHQKIEAIERARLVESERARIAHDLHDDLGTGLTEIDTTSALGQDSLLQPYDTREYFKEISQRSREMVTALDEIVWATNPKNDNIGSLASYFSHFAEGFLRPTAINCRFNVADELPTLPLDSNKRHSLFLAFKEALNNAVRHAQAKNIELAIKLEKNVVCISITDDGHGFGPEEVCPGADGLANMRQRLEKLGGCCKIVSNPESGTRVTFVLPL